MADKIIITGAGGFVGSALTQKFLEMGYEIIAISQYFNDSFPVSEHVTKLELEINSVVELKKYIPKDEYRAFYHLAWRGVNGVEKADSDIQIQNIKMTIICAKVAHELSCKRFLCSGTVAERALESIHSLTTISAGMTYSAAKCCAHIMLESYCKSIGLPFVWMQFSNIFGPLNKTGNIVSYALEQLKNGRDATFGPALQPYDFIFIDDVIEAIYRLGFYDVKKDFYFIGSGEPRELKDYLNIIGEIYGSQKHIKIGVRPDDGIKYSMEMFDIKELVKDIGDYVSGSFEDHIRYTIERY